MAVLLWNEVLSQGNETKKINMCLNATPGKQGLLPVGSERVQVRSNTKTPSETLNTASASFGHSSIGCGHQH
jgi:hypothetical protein